MSNQSLVSFNFSRSNSIFVREYSYNSKKIIEIFFCTKTPTASISEICRLFGEIKLTEKTEDEINKKISENFSITKTDASEIIDEFETSADLSKIIKEIPEVEDLLDSTDNAPIIKMINVIFSQGLREKASDIHIEPFEKKSLIRFRIDGNLVEIVQVKRELHDSLVSRIKVMSKLDIAEKRLPQDGRIALKNGGKQFDVRVSTLPTSFGERIVLRILDKDKSRLTMKELGMSDETLSNFQKLISQPNGIILVTGPTGSGKTTTLYAALNKLNDKNRNIMTVEDPVEYEINGIGQTQVNSRINMSFAKALRSILRQDPDIIMIGEIRDNETAQIAIQASLTGHLVFATLHTNDTASAITRLLDMGIEPFLLSSSLLGVISQRLLRKLCNNCKILKGENWEESGCINCSMTGYSGRVGIYETLIIDNELKQLIHLKKSENDLKKYAINNKMITMFEDGKRWVQAGVTTQNELVRVTKQ